MCATRLACTQQVFCALNKFCECPTGFACVTQVLRARNKICVCTTRFVQMKAGMLSGTVYYAGKGSNF